MHCPLFGEQGTPLNPIERMCNIKSGGAYFSMGRGPNDAYNIAAALQLHGYVAEAALLRGCFVQIPLASTLNSIK